MNTQLTASTSATKFPALIGAAALLALAGAALAAPTFNYTVLLRDGDAINAPNGGPNVGGVTFFNNMKINNNGVWYTQLDTDGSTASNSLTVRNGVSIFQEGSDSDPALPGTFLGLPANTGGGFNDSGDWSTNITLTGAGVTPTTDTSVVVNGRVIWRESNPVTDTAFPAGQGYQGFFHTKMDNAKNVYLMSSVANIGTTTNLKRAFLKLVYNPSTQTYSDDILMRADDPVPGTTSSVISDFDTGHQGWNVSSNGNTICLATYSPSFVLNGVTGNGAVYVNGTLLIKEGDPVDGVPGRNWRLLDGGGVGINANGDVVIRGTMDGDTTTDGIIMKRVGGVWSVVAQEGVTTHPDFPGMVVNALTTEVSIDNAGNVMWPCTFRTPPNTTNTGTGLFYNNQLVMRQASAANLIDGFQLSTLRVISQGHQMNEAGTAALVRVVLDYPSPTTDKDALVRVDIVNPVASGCNPADIACDDGTPLAQAPGCTNSPSGPNEGDYNAFFAADGFFFQAGQGIAAVGGTCDIACDDGTPLADAPGCVNNGVNEGDYNCFFNNLFLPCV